MLEWESPPDFTSGILSATKLKVLSRDLDFLQGRADGPKSVFCGAYYTRSIPGTWMIAWRGWIRHQKNTFRWVIWYRGRQIKMRIYYTGNLIVNTMWQIDPDGTDWKKEIGTYDLSGLGLTVGDWYEVKVEIAEEDGGIYGEGFHLAMLREEEAITGWQNIAVFDATEPTLDTKLDQISTNLNILKTASDAPDSIFTGVNIEPGSSEADVWLADDRGFCYCPNGHVYDKPSGTACSAAGCTTCGQTGITAFANSSFGAGCQHPGSSAKLYCAFRTDANVTVKVYYTGADGVWGTGHVVLNQTYSSEGTKEEAVNISGTPGAYCRLRITASKSTGSPEFKVLQCAVYDAASPSALKYWTHGDSLDFADLNTLRTRLNALNAPGKLDYYVNPAIKSLTTAGYRIFLRRRRGWRYLHYKGLGTDQDVGINYSSPSGLHGGKVALIKDTDIHTRDIDNIQMLYYGMYYNVNDAAFAQEWVDA